MIPSVEKLVRVMVGKPLWLWGPTKFDLLLSIAIVFDYAAGMVLTIYGIKGLMLSQLWVSMVAGPALLITARLAQWFRYGDNSMGGN